MKSEGSSCRKDTSGDKTYDETACGVFESFKTSLSVPGQTPLAPETYSQRGGGVHGQGDPDHEVHSPKQNLGDCVAMDTTLIPRTTTKQI